MSVWAYTRKSRALGDPDEDQNILAHQREALLRLAAQLGLGTPALIEEVGSGERLEDRVRLAAQLEAWDRERPPAGSVLLVTAIERITRGDMLEAGLIVRRLQKAGVIVQSLSQRFDLTQPDDMLLFSMLAVVGHHGLNRYRHDVMLRKDQLTRDGELPTGAAPFGYVWIKGRGRERGHLEVVPEKLAVVQWLFEQAPTMSIARLARATGLPRLTVAWILHNPVYTGYPHRHTKGTRSRSGKYGSKLLRPTQWEVLAEKAGNYPPAVSPAQFEQVQKALFDRWCLKEKTGEFDGWCKQLLDREGEPSRVSLSIEGRNRVPCYVFTSLETGRRVSYPRAAIHQAAREAVFAALSNPDWVRQALEQEEERQAREAAGGDRQQMEAELHRLRQTLVNLRLQAASPDPEDRLADLTAADRVKQDIRRLQASLAQTAPHGRGRLLATLGPFVGLLGEVLPERWETLTTAQKAAITGALLARIVVRITPKGRHGTNEREILSVEYQEWYQRFAE